MASLLQRSEDNVDSHTDDDTEDDYHGVDDKELDSRFIQIAADTLRNFPELQQCELYAALLERTSRVDSSAAIQIQSLPKSHHPNVVYAIAILVVSLILAILVIQPFTAYVLGIRCFVPNNYLVWEATRPVSDCSYCRNVRRPLILPNMTQQEFLVYKTMLNIYIYILLRFIFI